MIVRNGIVSHIQGLLKLILLKCPYYPRQSTHLIKSLSKYPGHFFFRTRSNNCKIYIKWQKTMNNQSKLEKKEQSWRCHIPWLQTILQSYNNQNRIVSSQKQTQRSIEQNTFSINKPAHLWPINLQKK